ncbi:hypothetical protein BCEP4_1730008 [Burkholderia cepacia]|nr:hypothetical protein BCEP4_1730008 [Burkholderia cepacia]
MHVPRLARGFPLHRTSCERPLGGDEGPMQELRRMSITQSGRVVASLRSPAQQLHAPASDMSKRHVRRFRSSSG